MFVLGIHLGHDSSCAIVKDGKIIAAAAEERFTRLKHYSYAPIRSLKFCLETAKIDPREIDLVVIPSLVTPSEINAILNLKNDVITGQNEFVKKDLSHFTRKIIIQILRNLNKTTLIELPEYLPKYNLRESVEIVNLEHHLAHAASGYFTSGFDEKTLIITADGAGDGLSLTAWEGINNELKPLVKIGRDGSLGAFYSTVTESLGWEVGDGEGKTMGLAPYGNAKKIHGVLDFIRPLFKKGKLAKKYDWGFPGMFRDMGTEHWHYKKSKTVTQLIKKIGRENIAAEAQRVLEEELLGFITYWAQRTKAEYLASSGGVFLNVKVNQRILESNLFKDYYVYPDAGDAGLSVGAALYGYFQKNPNQKPQKIKSVYFGQEYNNSVIEKTLRLRNISYKKVTQKDLVKITAKLLCQGKIIGWFQGREEVGPRALGNRSILMDPRKAQNKDIINSRVKFREGFRPFCPSVIAEEAKNYFRNIKEAPFMIVSYDVLEEKKKVIPAVTHVDGTARPQTVTKSQNPLYYFLLKEFGKITGVPVLLNTSFNIKGEPIVHTPSDAIRCFYDTGLDYLILGNFILEK